VRSQQAEVLGGGVPGLPSVVLASVCAGFGGVFAALAAEDGAGTPETLAFRAFGLLPMLVLFLTSERRARARGSVRLLLAMTVLSTFNVTAYYTAVGHMSPAFVGLLLYSYPAFVIAGACSLRWQRFDAHTSLALALVLSGVVITIGIPGGGLDPLGSALALGGAVGFAAYSILAQRTLRDVDPLTTVAFEGGLSSVALLVIVAIVGFQPPDGGQALMNLVLIALVSSLAAHLLIMVGLRRLGSVWSALASSLEVLTAVVASALLLGTTFAPQVVAGGALLILGGVAAPVLARGSRGAVGGSLGAP
jgi:drug/metabolite transporter (DMT)-like permease